MKGLYSDLSFAEYHRVDACSQSMLRALRVSPAHCRYYLDHPGDSSDAQIFGQAVHCAILQPDEFHETYATGPEVDRRTKIGKEEWAKFEEQNLGKTLLKTSHSNAIVALFKAIENHPTASKLLSPKEPEISFFWEDKETRQLCKGRLDSWNPNLNAVIDLKTTTDASPRVFERQIFSLGYHRQAAWYCRGLAQLGRDVSTFIFIAIEKDPPYGIGLFGMTKEVLEAADRENQDLLKIYADCKLNNFWPGYPDAVREVQLPVWMKDPEVTNVEEY